MNKPAPSQTFSIEASRLLFEQALKTEKADAQVEAEFAHKRAINAYTGASILVPAEVTAPIGTATAEAGKTG